MTQLQHPNLLPLLAQAVVPDRSDGRMLQLVYMLFPVYEASAFSSSFLLDTQGWTPDESQQAATGVECVPLWHHMVC